MLKIFKIVLRILPSIFLISISVAVELFANIWLDSYLDMAIRYSVHFIVFCLLFWLLKPLFPASWKTKKSFLISVLLLISTLTTLRIVTYYSDKRLGVKQFDYTVANCFELSRGLLRNDFLSKNLERASTVFPFSHRYLMITMGDGCRVLRVKDNVYDDDKRKDICPGDSRVECFKKVITASGQKESYTITGNILLVAVGAMLVFEEKKLYDLQDHPLLSDEIRKRNRDLATFRITTDLFEVLALVEKTYSDEKSIHQMFPDLPSEEFALIPNSVKEKVKTMLDNDIISNSDDEFWYMLFGGKTRYHDSFTKIKSSTIEAYLLMLMNSSISDKLHKTSCKSLSGMIKGLSEKINDPEFIKSFSPEEFTRLSTKFNNYKNREYCKGISEVKEFIK